MHTVTAVRLTLCCILTDYCNHCAICQSVTLRLMWMSACVCVSVRGKKCVTSACVSGNLQGGKNKMRWNTFTWQNFLTSHSLFPSIQTLFFHPSVLSLVLFSSSFLIFSFKHLTNSPVQQVLWVGLALGMPVSENIFNKPPCWVPVRVNSLSFNLFT